MEITTCLCFKRLNSVTCIIELFDQITKRNLKISLMFVKKNNANCRRTRYPAIYTGTCITLIVKYIACSSLKKKCSVNKNILYDTKRFSY